MTFPGSGLSAVKMTVTVVEFAASRCIFQSSGERTRNGLPFACLETTCMSIPLKRTLSWNTMLHCRKWSASPAPGIITWRPAHVRVPSADWDHRHGLSVSIGDLPTARWGFVDTLETGTTLVVLSRSDIVLGGSTIGTTAVAEDSIVPGGAVLMGWCSSMLGAIRLLVRNGNRRPIVAPIAAQDRTIAIAPNVEEGKRPRAAKECLCGRKFI